MTEEPLSQLLAALLITRQVVGNIKESLVPYAKKQLKVDRSKGQTNCRLLQMAKMSFDLYGALSPTQVLTV